MFEFVMISSTSILYIALLALLVKKHNRLGKFSVALITIFCMILSCVGFFAWAVLNYGGMDSAVTLLKNEYPVMVWIAASTVFFFAPLVFLLIADPDYDSQDESHWTDRKIAIMKEREELFMKKAQEFQKEKKELIDLKKEVEAKLSLTSDEEQKLRRQVEGLNRALAEIKNRTAHLQNQKIYSDGFYRFCLNNLGMQRSEIDSLKMGFLEEHKQNQKGKQAPKDSQ